MIATANNRSSVSAAVHFYQRISANSARRQAFERMLVEDGYGDLDRYCLGAERFYGQVDPEGKEVLEIGSGRGLTIMFLALQNARHVVSMEPELAGSRGGLLEIQQRRIAALNVGHIVELLNADFNTWDAQGRRFDVIVSQSSINHLYESPYHALRHRETYERYRQISQHILSLLNPGGVFCVTDASRYGFFSLTRKLGLRRPWGRKRLSTNWKIHQTGGVWRKILLDAGFASVDTDYPLPYTLRHFGPVVANPVANFFLRAKFILRAYA